MYQFKDFALNEEAGDMLSIVARFEKGKGGLLPGLSIPKDATLTEFREALEAWVENIKKSEAHLQNRGRL